MYFILILKLEFNEKILLKKAFVIIFLKIFFNKLRKIIVKIKNNKFTNYNQF